MTTERILEIKDGVIEMSNVVIELLAKINELELDKANLENAINELSTFEPEPREETTREISTDFLRQPELPSSLPTVRFLSRISGLGGLANIRASMADHDINVKRLRLEGSNYTPNDSTLIINWGGGFQIPQNLNNFTGRWLNKLDAVKIAANKLKTFEALYANEALKRYIPPFTSSKAEAEEKAWSITYCRETLYGHSGDGIRVINSGDRLVEAPLYVKGMNVRHEYRVHTVNGFTKVQKKAALETENPNTDVRNIDGGWTYINEFTLSDSSRALLHKLSVDTIECLGLDFGAVDIIRTENGNFKILEVNTAPGVASPSNIEWYTKALVQEA